MSKSLQTSQITSAIKRANQRIAQIGKTYGTKSHTYNKEAGKFLKGAWKDYISVSVGGKEFYRRNKETGERYLYAVSKGGNIKFDTKKIMDLIRKEGASSKVNRLLGELAGIKIDDDGNVVELKGGGVPTLKEIDKRTEKRLENWGEDPGEVSIKRKREITEELNEFRENFQSSYETYMAKYGEAEARADSTIQSLYGDYRDRRLTYPELQRVKNKMDEYIAAARSEALEFENDNSPEL